VSWSTTKKKIKTYSLSPKDNFFEKPFDNQVLKLLNINSQKNYTWNYTGYIAYMIFGNWVVLLLKNCAINEKKTRQQHHSFSLNFPHPFGGSHFSFPSGKALLFLLTSSVLWPHLLCFFFLLPAFPSPPPNSHFSHSTLSICPFSWPFPFLPTTGHWDFYKRLLLHSSPKITQSKELIVFKNISDDIILKLSKGIIS
jgi:hypothetical protein